ncbi:baeRF11 domain-containing protein [Microterricola pindariensis]|uniref:Peptide chain release factor 1 n=1 Tax=Microterricola pindariensis TaxID=478010 RepID=A0ABX5ASU2_9MICO|nr:hypothetical protein [Microterricola pindariensis]PPL14554.1 hypothetical protein GY24_16010 [Microterricola pindariensis]
MQHTDIPSRDSILSLATARDPLSVSIYLPTSPLPQESEASRIALRNQVDEAQRQLLAVGADKREVAAITEQIGDFIADRAFWTHLSNSLAIFVTPTSLKTYRLPNRLEAAVEVADRFYVKPLMRAATFPQTAYVLALAQNSVRLLEISADDVPHRITVDGMPENVADGAGLDPIAGRSPVGHQTGGRAGGGNTPAGRVQGAEGQKVRMAEYSRAIVRALRPLFNGLNVPLIIAGAEPLVSIFRSVATYPHLASQTITGNPEEIPDADLAASARLILDEIYAAQLAALRDNFADRHANGRASTDLSDVARAATFGAIETLFVDIDRSIPGRIDSESGAVTVAEEDNAVNYGVVDEILRRALLSGSQIFAVRAEDVPGGGAFAATLRFAA